MWTMVLFSPLVEDYLDGLQELQVHCLPVGFKDGFFPGYPGYRQPNSFSIFLKENWALGIVATASHEELVDHLCLSLLSATLILIEGRWSFTHHNTKSKLMNLVLSILPWSTRFPQYSLLLLIIQGRLSSYTNKNSVHTSRLTPPQPIPSMGK